MSFRKNKFIIVSLPIILILITSIFAILYISHQKYTGFHSTEQCSNETRVTFKPNISFQKVNSIVNSLKFPPTYKERLNQELGTYGKTITLPYEPYTQNGKTYLNIEQTVINNLEKNPAYISYSDWQGIIVMDMTISDNDIKTIIKNSTTIPIEKFSIKTNNVIHIPTDSKDEAIKNTQTLTENPYVMSASTETPCYILL